MVSVTDACASPCAREDSRVQLRRAHRNQCRCAVARRCRWHFRQRRSNGAAGMDLRLGEAHGMAEVGRWSVERSEMMYSRGVPKCRGAHRVSAANLRGRARSANRAPYRTTSYRGVVGGAGARHTGHAAFWVAQMMPAQCFPQSLPLSRSFPRSMRRISEVQTYALARYAVASLVMVRGLRWRLAADRPP